MTHVHQRALSLLHLTLLTLHFTSLLPAHSFHSHLAPTFPFRTGDPPVGRFYILHWTLFGAFSSGCLNHDWNLVVSHNHRHLSHEPGANQTQVHVWQTAPRSSQSETVESNFIMKSIFKILFATVPTKFNKVICLSYAETHWLNFSNKFKIMKEVILSVYFFSFNLILLFKL